MDEDCEELSVVADPWNLKGNYIKSKTALVECFKFGFILETIYINWLGGQSWSAEPKMISCVDVDYRTTAAVAACVVFSFWGQSSSEAEFIERVSKVAPYEPGQFYRRELPCILAVLKMVQPIPNIIVVDGYVWLSAEGRPGLGAHLYEALGRKSEVVGVAKSSFFEGPNVAEVIRSRSSRPLFVTSVGIPLEEATSAIQHMHGGFRIPTLIKRVDELARNG
jgi:deoxyribonuclease V